MRSSGSVSGSWLTSCGHIVIVHVVLYFSVTGIVVWSYESKNLRQFQDGEALHTMIL